MNAGSPLVNAGALSEEYAPLDALPDGLYHAVITHPQGNLLERVRGILSLREAFLRGEVFGGGEPPWPGGDIGHRLVATIQSMGLLRYCRGEPEIVDALLLDILQIALSSIQRMEDLIRRIFEELTARETARLKAAERVDAIRIEDLAEHFRKGRQTKRPKKERYDERPPDLDEPTRRRLAHEARLEAEKRIAPLAADALKEIWAERVAIWKELEEIFGALGELIGVGWDLSRGLLRSQGWLEAARLRALLERLPAMREVVRALGRMSVSEKADAPAVLVKVLGPLRRVVEEKRRIHSPLAPTETRGVERSAEINRMLPSEAALLTRPVLRLLWHARRAERGLMTYRAEGIILDPILVDQDISHVQEERQPREERGPILLCIDVSGSMAGVPETVAKAVALEAMRIAHAEKRACYVYLFSGPGDVVEHELSLSPGGLTNLVAFLSLSFHGGTDVVEPLSRALARTEQLAWREADILLVSDGYLVVPEQTSAAVRRARAAGGARVHGLLISSSASHAMTELCDPLHSFCEWRDVLEGAAGR